MRSIFLAFIFLLGFSVRSQAASSVLDLVGNWQGAVQFGKFQFRIILHIAKTDDAKIAVTMDNPDQGMKGLPVSALLYNDPAVRLEIDQFGTAFTGAVSKDGKEIVGGFDEGPGGKPISLTFKRFAESDKPEPERSYTFAAGEASDIRGYWKGSLELSREIVLRLGMKIGRATDGSFSATLDIFDHGARDIPSTSVSYTNSAAKLEWQLFQLVFDATLSPDGNKLSGNWKQGGRNSPVTFERLDKPATILAPDLSFVPEKGSATDIRGHWKGTLETPGARLRLVLKIGKAPDGSYAGTMHSLDQGAREMPSTAMKFDKGEVHLEWKAINGSFKGTLSDDGTVMEGEWKQGPNPLPLKFERTPAPEATK